MTTAAASLTSALETRLADIAPVYGARTIKPDRIQPPYILLRIGEDELKRKNSKTLIRLAHYEIEGVLARSASLQDLQQLHHDILTALVMALPLISPQPAEWLDSESTEYEPRDGSGAPGSTVRSLIVSLAINYIEPY